MTVASITEDRSDSEIVAALVGRIVGRDLRATHYLSKVGFSAVLTSARPLAICAARARPSFIVVMVDCDETDDHFTAPAPHAKCRLCQLERVLPEPHEVARLSENSSRLVAALPVRTLETWLAVAGGLAVPGSIHDFGRAPHDRRRLKEIVHGEASPSRVDVIRRGIELIRLADVDQMEKTLSSFASFAALVRA